jgi:flagellar hook-associated protein 2
MATFSALGIGSGIDAEALVSQLMSLERRPITQLTTKETGVKAKISAYGTIKSALDSLKSAADVLGDANKLSAFKATFADSTYASATATSSASAGTYSLNVIRLATAHKVGSDTNFASSTALVGQGTFSITVGTTTTNIALTSPTATLSDLRAAINASSAAGVTASIVSGDTGTKLVLSPTIISPMVAISRSWLPSARSARHRRRLKSKLTVLPLLRIATRSQVRCLVSV